MQQPEGHNRLIAKNATMLYLRMFVTLAISFYTSRIVLKALGVSDYGIYNVVGGVITFINVLTSSLGSATSRFLTYSLGKDDIDDLRKTFSTAFIIHLSLAGIFLILAESIGLWFINTQLIIPPDRMLAANWVYQSAILSTALAITQVPYDASIQSHEKMAAFAYIAIINAILKLLIAFVVLYAAVDHLILYSVLYMVLSFGFVGYYRYYCIRNFEESKLKWIFEKKVFKEMLSFSAWNMYGSVSLTAMQQGVNILINRFFGTILNAAVGIAGQVQAIIYSFIGNVTAAFRPQIIKEYASENYSRVNYLIQIGTKFTAVVGIITIVPVAFNLEFLMNLWLDTVPIGAIIICQILLLENYLNSFHILVYFGITATGHIKMMQFILGTMYIGSLVLFYLALKITHSYVAVYIIGIFLCPLSTLTYCLVFKKNMPAFNLRAFMSKVYLPVTVIGLLSIVMALSSIFLFSSQLFRFLYSLIACTAIVCTLSYYFLLDSYMRSVCKDFIKGKLHKNGKR